MNSTNEPAYWSKEVSEILQISDSTLRKWCIALEKNGYAFTRGANNSRAYLERDVLLLRRLKELVQGKGLTVEAAVSVVMAQVPEPERTAPVHDVNTVSPIPLQQMMILKEILDRQERLEQFILKQQRFIEETLEKRDRDLTNAIKESLETRKNLAASQEKKGFWARLFGK